MSALWPNLVQSGRALHEAGSDPLHNSWISLPVSFTTTPPKRCGFRQCSLRNLKHEDVPGDAKLSNMTSLVCSQAWAPRAI